MPNNQKNFYRRVYRKDRIARYVITAGGYGIVVSIVAILLFLSYQSLPLSFGASLKKAFSFDMRNSNPRVLLIGIDQYQELFYSLDEEGIIRFYQTADRKLLQTDSIPLASGEKILSASKGSLQRDIFAAGTNLGRIITAEIRMRPEFTGSTRRVVPYFEVQENWQAEEPSDSLPAHIEKMVFRQNEDLFRFWVWEDHAGKVFLRIFDADEEAYYSNQLSDKLGETAVSALTMSYNGENLVLGGTDGQLFWFDISDFENPRLRDNWHPYAAPISSVRYLLGDNALIVGNTEGTVELWFPVRTPSNLFKFTRVHQFKSHTGAVLQIYPSPRNRNFLTVDNKGNVHLNYSTTGRTQLEFKASQYPIQAASFAPKSNGIILIDTFDRVAHYFLRNPHPEATLNTLFGKVWYEGYPTPEFVWQSTGGSDEFEPKLSLIPLIFGTFKGTLYAMFFSVPIALLAAIYVSQFAPVWLARVVKPTVEIMAALPSVVIGFLAGLYFSPLFEKHLMSAIMFLIMLPVMFFLAVLCWRLVPEHHRMRFPVGWELLITLPVALLTIWLSFSLQHPLESLLFGGDVKQWLYNALGLIYDTRNSFVVGFALGFAVIPIIFTMSEDALANVPDSLSSASLALGASRWQTVRRVVLPAAYGGIFAAIMLGFGRAVGETMIVLMATGNTPIIDLSPFNGFRAMSACIAVEIPEAPVGGTLYRVLFLTALLLFVFTFFINTIASLIGDRLRKKYSRF